jgi:hypothetical protein
MASGNLQASHCLEFLVKNQNSDGGWGFHPASPSAVEATAWALMALTSSGGAPEECSRARGWLLEVQLPDGSWPALPGQTQGCWVTSLACHALYLQGESDDAVRRGLHWLLDQWPAEGTWWWRLRHWIFHSRVASQDSSLRGWNWTPGTASWVEPTAQALIFLRLLPREWDSSPLTKRQQLAERMLYDRMCPGGGWNSGNPLIYGVPGVPRIGPTAWALLALRDHPGSAEVQTSLEWLERAYPAIHGAATLALANRCLTALGRTVPPLALAVEELYSQNVFYENVLTIAWILLALNGEGKGVVPAEAKTTQR